MNFKRKLIQSSLALGLAAFASTQANAAILNVCQSGCSFSLPSQAYNSAAAGDTIQIQPGTYNDCIYIQKNNLTITGVNGMPKMVSKVCGQKGILVTAAQNLTIKNLELSGATNNDNYAGVRHDAAGYNLTMDNVYIHDNDDGILSSSSGDTITITNSRFENNGMNSGNGYAHNLYIGNAAKVVFSGSRSTNAKLQGHEFKTRAARTEILGSTLATLGGADSRLIDVSNGGTLIVQDSVLEKSSGSANNEMIAFGPEGWGSGRTHSVTITGNKVIGDRNPTDLIYFYNGTPSMNISSNTFVAIRTVTNAGSAGANTVYSSRSAAGYQAYPWLPSPGATTTTPPPTTSDWTFCANEGGTCSFSGTRSVRYGANGSYITKTNVTGSINCNNTAFGSDPAYGVAKKCEYSNSTTTAPTTSGFYNIRTRVNTAYCADAPSSNNGTQLHLWQCVGNDNQKFEYASTGEIKVHGKCMDGSSGKAGDPVVVYDCHGGSNQKWTHDQNTGEIKGINGLCVDLWGGTAANDAKLNLYSCHGGTNQKWNRTAL